MNNINRQIARLETLPVAQEHVAATAMADRLGAIVDLYKAEYPVFDEESDVFDQDVVNWVARQQGMYQNAGVSPPVALQEAADLAVLKFGLKSVSGKTEPPKKPSKAEKDAERTEKGVEKSLEARRKQPALLSDVGTDSDKAGLTKINIMELSQEDFSKLPESQLKRLRGDIL
jgi:hypothetical protein